MGETLELRQKDPSPLSDFCWSILLQSQEKKTEAKDRKNKSAHVRYRFKKIYFQSTVDEVHKHRTCQSDGPAIYLATENER
jgi:hypothetical protein